MHDLMPIETRDPVRVDSDQGLLHGSGVDGVYGRSGAYEAVVTGLNRFLDGQRPAGAEVLRFPSVMSRAHLERSGYLKSFPNLLADLHGFCGTQRTAQEIVQSDSPGDVWRAATAATELVMTPAACYPIYPILAARGRLPAGGWRGDTLCECFRREPSQAIDRLQSFRMREFVCVGEASHALDFRETWLKRAQDLAAQLGLNAKIEVAHDPFFSRMGEFMARSQLEQALKFELLCPVRGDGGLTAVLSFNYHQDHFGEVWGIQTDDGGAAHSSCVATGLDRLALALFYAHGADLSRWPAAVKVLLGLD